jgi:glucokinase
MTHSRTALIGAIGDTHIALAVGDVDEMSVTQFALLSSADFASPMEAIARYLKSVPVPPRSVALAVAGEVTGESVAMAARGWHFSAQDIGAVLGTDRVMLVPEMEALVRFVPHVQAADLVIVNTGTPTPDTPVLLINCGNSLGAAASLGPKWTGPIVHGQVDFMDLPGDVHGLKGFDRAADLLTGPGLMAAYHTLRGAKANGSAAAVIKLGLSGDDDIASATLDLVARSLGQFAGELTLAYGAGRVFMAGTVASSLLPHRLEQFMQGFTAKGQAAARMEAIPVAIIKTAADAAMRGAAALFAARPEA